MNCLVVDDEPIARDGIRKYIDKLDFLTFSGFAKDVDTTVQVLKSNQIDLLFIDIEMPGVSGMEFVRTYSEKLPLIIFITAYSNYAVESYDLHAVDYLLKPVSFERFVDAATRALNIHERNVQSNHDDIQPTFFVRHDGRYQKINSEEIVYVSAMQNYIRIHFLDTKTIVIHYTLKAIQEFLDSATFIQIHKSYIINIGHIESVSSTAVVLKAVGQIPVGRSFREEVIPVLLRSF